MHLGNVASLKYYSVAMINSQSLRVLHPNVVCSGDELHNIEVATMFGSRLQQSTACFGVNKLSGLEIVILLVTSVLDLKPSRPRDIRNNVTLM